MRFSIAKVQKHRKYIARKYGVPFRSVHVAFERMQMNRSKRTTGFLFWKNPSF